MSADKGVKKYKVEFNSAIARYLVMGKKGLIASCTFYNDANRICDVLNSHDSQVQALKADLEALVKMYSTKIKRNCQHDDPSWCNQFCNDYGDLARQIGDKNGIKYE